MTKNNVTSTFIKQHQHHSAWRSLVKLPMRASASPQQ